MEDCLCCLSLEPERRPARFAMGIAIIHGDGCLPTFRVQGYRVWG